MGDENDIDDDQYDLVQLSPNEVLLVSLTSIFSSFSLSLSLSLSPSLLVLFLKLKTRLRKKRKRKSIEFGFQHAGSVCPP
jgi:hypothetical protein